MRKSIFAKYFLICTAVILISFICLGAVLLLVSSQYFVSETKEELYASVDKAVSMAQDTADIGSDEWKAHMNDKLSAISHGSANEVFITDTNGKILTYSENIAFISAQGFLRGEHATVVNVGGDYLRSDLDILDEEYHIIRKSEKISGNEYYVFAMLPMSEQNSYIGNIMQLFGISVLVVLVFVVIVVYLGILHITRPISALCNAANRFANGDFSQMIDSSDCAEFQELGAALNEMAISVSNMEYMRKSFIANVSHELRTPMTSIGGFVDGMLDGTIPQTEYKKYFRIISAEVYRLTRLVRSMLNLSKIEAGDMSIDCSEFSVLEPIVDTLSTFETQLMQKNVQIKGLDTSRITVYADIDLIHQVIYNLIENAVKFVNENGTIEFDFTRADDMTYLSIKNTGEGISQEQLPLIFDRFYKVDQSRGKDAKGVGLGLYIVKSIVNLHGGNVTVKSKVSEYTEFILSLPDKAKSEEK